MILKFFLSDSFSFDSGKMDLRTNPFKEGEYDTSWIEHRPVWFMDTAQGGVLVYQLEQTEVFMLDHASPTAHVISLIFPSMLIIISLWIVLIRPSVLTHPITPTVPHVLSIVLTHGCPYWSSV